MFVSDCLISVRTTIQSAGKVVREIDTVSWTTALDCTLDVGKKSRHVDVSYFNDGGVVRVL